MASLANQTISSTYDGLIKTSSDNAVPVSGVQALEDGSGNALALSVGRSGNGVTVTGNLAVDTNTLYVDAASNNIGIGVQPRTSGVRTLEMPNWVLEDNGAFGFKVNAYYDGTNNKYINTGAAARLYSDDGYFAFFNAPSGTAGTNVTFEERMRIDSSGNVGVKKDALLAAGLGYAGDTTSAGAGKITLYDSSTGALVINGFGAGYLANSGIHFQVAGSEKMRITSSGNVGIGTTGGNGKLNVGASSASAVRHAEFANSQLGSSFSAGSFITLGRADINRSMDVGIYGNGSNEFDGKIVVNETGGSLILGTVGSERMRITSGGFLKASDTGSYLGATNSYHEFNNSSTEWTQVNTNTNSVGQGLLLRLNSSTASTLFLAGYSTNISAYRFKIYADGDIENANNSYGVLSDAKLKENIVDATPKLDELMQVKIRNYNLIGDDLKQIGVVAQELEEVFPAIVYERPDTKEVQVTDEDGSVTTERIETGETTKSVKMSVFVPILIKAMQEQQEIINDLKARIETLEAK